MSDETNGEPLDPGRDAHGDGGDLGGAPGAEPSDASPAPGSDRPPRKLPHLTPDELVCVLDELGRKHYFMDGGRPVCGRLKRKHNREIENEACLGIPMANGACRVHGGKAGAPIRHGRYSRILTKWRGDFERARADRELLDSRRELALMDVAVEKLLARAEELDSPSWREELLETFEALKVAIRAQRQAQVNSLMSRLGELIERGARFDEVSHELVAQVDRRANRACRLEELQIRREERITARELAAVFGQWLGVLEKRLDRDAFHDVLPELRRVTTVRQIAPQGRGGGARGTGSS